MFFCKVATVALNGSVPVRVCVIRKVVDKAFSVKTCNFEFGFPSTPCDPEQAGLADLWKAASKTRGAVQAVVVKGARAVELVVRGPLVIRLNSQRPLIALLVLRSRFPRFSPVKTALSQMNHHVARHGAPLPAGLRVPGGSLDLRALGTEV